MTKHYGYSPNHEMGGGTLTENCHNLFPVVFFVYALLAAGRKESAGLSFWVTQPISERQMQQVWV